MTVSSGLVPDLQKRVRLLEADLRAQSDEPSNEWGGALRSEHSRALSRGRTGLSWSEWRDGEVAQAAVAWVLACVFVRFCEDNALIDGVWLAGPGERTARAVDAETAFYTDVPSRTATDWLRESFGALAGVPAGRGLVDPAHSPVWSVGIGPDAARELVAFWRETDADGELVRDFTDAELDTRFLGDLYQDLSEFAKKKYALLQTPVFVEEFILDRTLTPALEEFGLEGLRLIDPTCGSGHFLLGAFGRLVEAWGVHAPGLTPEARVQRALDSVHGVDLNPFAVAIARFRLTVAALQAAGITSLSKAPAFAYHVAVGDSLLAGTAGRQGELFAGDGAADDSLGRFEYPAEDVSEHRGILDPGRYHVVVGNPPYITPSDPALNDAYRHAYPSVCHREYQLSAPFCYRFFALASTAGFVGQITSNAFMRRAFGERLIEGLLNGSDPLVPVDLQLVADTSGAYIPGHGTPTIILVGRRRAPLGDGVVVVRSRRGEPGRPADPATGLVWTDILKALQSVPCSGSFAESVEWPRERLSRSPWLLQAGGYELVERMGWTPTSPATRPLGSIAESIGYTGQTNCDDVFLGPRDSFIRQGVEAALVRPVVAGGGVRDYQVNPRESAFFPYQAGTLDRLDAIPGAARWLWPFRSNTWARATFSKRTYRAEGRTWWEWHQVALHRLESPFSVLFPDVATHNHVALDVSGLVVNSTARGIKLGPGSSLNEYIQLLALLGTSTTCFWLKQVCHDKGGQGVNEGFKSQAWERFYQFSGNKWLDLPLPLEMPGERAAALHERSMRLLELARSVRGTTSRARWSSLQVELIFVQEELDWEVYRAYGLIENDLTYAGSGIDAIQLGERAFEVALARQVAAGLEETAWFERHGSTPITELPDEWPDDYRALVERRLALIESDPFIGLLERPEFKRRWASRSWEELEREALTEFVLDRLEAPELWSSDGSPGVVSVARLADRVRGDGQLVEALRLLTSQQDVDVTAELSKLVAGECVPFLAAYRYTELGLIKRAEWESVWALQRREDAGEKVDIPVPPKYTNKDFVKVSYWSARGKLDVPKERFVSFPGLERAGDSTLVLGWAGWDHLEQARALASAISQGVQEEGWGRDRLVPLLAGLLELVPWLHQWHDDPDPVFGGSPAVFMSAFLDGELDRLGLTRTDLATWRPAAASRGRGRKAAAVREEIDS